MDFALGIKGSDRLETAGGVGHPSYLMFTYVTAVSSFDVLFAQLIYSKAQEGDT